MARRVAERAEIDLAVFPKSYRLDLVSSIELSNGTVGLHYRRHR